jgi:hypothetical protein
VTFRVAHVAAVVSALTLAAACSHPGSTDTSAPAIRLATPPDGGTAYVEVTGLGDGALEALEDADYSPEQWAGILRVSVDPDAPPVLGSYTVNDEALRFEPTFAFDPGRQYTVRFEPSRLPGENGAQAPLIAAVGLPASTAAPSTSVVQIYPSSDIVPENQLRFYVQFSAPMSWRSGLEHIQLLDERGVVVPEAFLPLDYEFWNPERTRFTVFFDPGRVKTGILPHEQLGRPLRNGGSYTIVVSREWRDANGLPLKEDYRRTFRVGPEQNKALDPSRWQIASPAAGSRDGLRVTFPEPLDHGLLMRALGVRFGTNNVEGEIHLSRGEKEWTFIPSEPWRAGSYQLLALSILEDVAGNQIGRAFEVDAFEEIDRSPEPETITLSFSVRPPAGTH